MRLTRLDFHRPQAGNSGLSVALLLGGLIAAVLAVSVDADQGEQLDRLQLVAQALKSDYRQLAQASRTEPAALLAKPRGGNALANATSAARWGQWLDAIETAQDDSIALLRIEPDPASGKLRLVGEAKDGNALIAYIQHLEGRGGIAEVQLLSQQIKSADAQKPIEFILGARLLAEAPTRGAAT